MQEIPGITLIWSQVSSDSATKPEQTGASEVQLEKI